jgi:hypothetical protein
MMLGGERMNLICGRVGSAGATVENESARLGLRIQSVPMDVREGG